ncbi:MAG: hypothetical protein QOD95_1458 [Gammaproteobacteria bacterium]|jgi:hypothetical protein|nr:hypothetical protein [Gammaproteobacteria bacterium]
MLREPLASAQVPLFITRFGLSDRTAIGVQTRGLLDHFTEYAHLYWHESLFDPAFARSHRIESLPFARIPHLKRDNAPARLLSKAGSGYWRNEQPTLKLKAFLSSLRQGISAVYLAPIDARDARRMRAVVEILDLPFVVHLWDFLDEGLDDPSTKWLIGNARHVFCLNQQLLDSVSSIQTGASILRFTRAQASVTPQYPNGKEMKVVIMGDIFPYLTGVKCLIRAVQILRKTSDSYRIEYVGNAKTLRRCGIDAHEFISATGFVVDASGRDQALANCAIGFMPGPTAAPDVDPRSKYSIPSRILDFMAVGLPVLGTVHSESATYSFCREMGIDRGLLSEDEGLLAEAIRALADEANWSRSRTRSLAAFEKHMKSYDIGRLKAFLNSGSATS